MNLESCRAVKLPWIFVGSPVDIKGAPGNIQDNLDRYDIKGRSDLCVNNMLMFELVWAILLIS